MLDFEFYQNKQSSEVNNYIKMDIEVNFIYLNDNNEQITLL